MKKQRCIGPKNAHTYMLNYVTQFSSNYKEVSRFSYVHLNTAHEASGTVISTLDADLVHFLNNTLSEDTVIFLMGDHGMRYGEWFTQLDGSHEHRLPLLYIISPAAILSQIPNSEKIAFHNSNRLVSKLDLYATILHLANLPLNAEKYIEILCNSSSTSRSVSLLYELVPNTRTCDDLQIPPFWCSCLAFTDQTDALQSTFPMISLINEVIWQINNEVANQKDICRTVTLKTIKGILSLENDPEFYYKIQFSVQQSETALFEVLILLSKRHLKKRLRDGFGSRPFYFNGKKTLKIMYIKRLDAYAGVCKEIANSLQINPILCICHEILDLAFRYPSLILPLTSKYRALINPSNQLCENVCSFINQDCNEFGKPLFSTCPSISSVCKSCSYTDSPTYTVNSHCFLNPQTPYSCASASAICYCKSSNYIEMG